MRRAPEILTFETPPVGPSTEGWITGLFLTVVFLCRISKERSRAQASWPWHPRAVPGVLRPAVLLRRASLLQHVGTRFAARSNARFFSSSSSGQSPKGASGLRVVRRPGEGGPCRASGSAERPPGFLRSSLCPLRLSPRLLLWLWGSCLPLIRPLVITRGPLDNPGSSPRLEILNVIHLQRPPATSGTRTCAPPGTILRSATRGRLRPPRTCNAAGVLCGRSVQTRERPYRTGSWGRCTPTPRTCRPSWLTWGLSQAPVLRLLARGADRSNPLWEQSRAPRPTAVEGQNPLLPRPSGGITEGCSTLSPAPRQHRTPGAHRTTPPVSLPSPPPAFPRITS